MGSVSHYWHGLQSGVRPTRDYDMILHVADDCRPASHDMLVPASKAPGLALQQLQQPCWSVCAVLSPHDAGERAAEALQGVSEQDAAIFLDAADSLLEDMDARQALARALVQLTGHTSLQVSTCMSSTLCASRLRL